MASTAVIIIELAQLHSRAQQQRFRLLRAGLCTRALFDTRIASIQATRLVLKQMLYANHRRGASAS